MEDSIITSSWQDGNNNNTTRILEPRYEILENTPDEKTQIIMWSVWSGVALAVGIFVSFIMIAMGLSKRVRRQNFNWYLFALMFPDAFLGLACGTNCLLNAIAGDLFSERMCNFQHWYAIWALGCNAWLNGVITFQMHRMLRYSRIRKRYHAPTKWNIFIQVLSVYSYMAFVAAWGIIEWPYKGEPLLHSGEANGMVCLPVELDRRSSLFMWTIFMPFFMLIPVVYIACACFDIYRRKLLPPPSKRRNVVIFGQLILAFFAMWLPSFIVIFVVSPHWSNPWVLWTGGVFSHFQGIVTSGISLLKIDIRHATIRLLQCRYCFSVDKSNNDEREQQQDDDGFNRSSGSGSIFEAPNPFASTRFSMGSSGDHDAIFNDDVFVSPSEDDTDEDEESSRKPQSEPMMVILESAREHGLAGEDDAETAAVDEEDGTECFLEETVPID